MQWAVTYEHEILYVKSRSARSRISKVGVHAITGRVNNRLPIRPTCRSSSRHMDVCPPSENQTSVQQLEFGVFGLRDDFAPELVSALPGHRGLGCICVNQMSG